MKRSSRSATCRSGDSSMSQAEVQLVAERAPERAPAEVIVRLEQISRVYRQDSNAVHALDWIDLEIRRGDFAVLVGPSGSGKTTLLNMIGALDSPTSGRIWVAGTEIGRMSKAELSEVRLRKIG